jgi:hypothetical protein
MARERSHAQLDLEWTDTMRWEDLPAAVRERVGERLAEVLRQVARASAEASGGEA